MDSLLSSFLAWLSSVLWTASVWTVPVLTAITLHEAAHGYVAERFGDNTARRLGRVSMNPLRHVDPFGTVLLPVVLLLTKAGFLFGYAKPVPVDFRNLNNPRRDMIFVAAAGPAMNLLMALLAAFLYHGLGLFSPRVAAWLFANIVNAIKLNVMLAVFNMLPIPPLDGGRVAVGLLPDWLAFPLAKLERSGIFIVLALLVLLPWAASHAGIVFNPLGELLRIMSDEVAEMVVIAAGW
jgi:Zn-dependent protease